MLKKKTESPTEEKSIVMNKSSKKKFANNPKFKHGAMATAITAGFIVVVILFNVLVGILIERFPSLNLDMTNDGTTNLTDDALKVIDSVDEKTEMYMILSEHEAQQSADYAQLSVLMQKIVERNGNISFDYIDSATNPGFMSTYQAEGLTNGDVLIKTDKRYRVVSSSTMFPATYDSNTYSYQYYTDTNAALANAISAVNSDTMPVVAVETGHNGLIDTTTLTNSLEKNNFEIKKFNLLTDEIPEGTQLIILPAPSTDLTQNEVEKLDAYLNDADSKLYLNLLVLYMPSMAEMPNLNQMMNEWGMNVEPLTEVSATSEGSYVQYQDYLIAQATDEVSFYGQSTYGYLLAPLSCPVEVLWESRNEITTTALLLSPEDVERKTYDPESGEMITTGSGQETLIGMGTKMFKYGDGYMDYRNANVVAMGCGFFIDQNFLNASAFSNATYAVDMCKYLTHTTGAASAVASNKVQVYEQDIAMSDAEVTGWGLYTFAIGIPVIFLLVGIVVFFKRRHL